MDSTGLYLRMFHNLPHSYQSVLENHADVKELIPEFYFHENYDFLINAQGLNLGMTQNGERRHLFFWNNMVKRWNVILYLW